MNLRVSLFLLLAVVTLGMNTANSKIWEATDDWSMHWEEEYADWISSRKVHKGMFVNRNSPYYGIKADCADAVYAMRAIFAYENSLPFKISAPSGSRGYFPYISNETSRFSNAGRPVKQLVAMINYLGMQVGTEHLAYNDSLPVKIKRIMPGTFNMYKIRIQNKTIRHTYIIKDIMQNGDFDLIWSTQAIARERAAMNGRVKTLTKAPTKGWGFRRFKWPQYIDDSASIYPVDFGYSTEQYQLVNQLGVRKFFRHVKKSLATVMESYDVMLKKQFNSLCVEAQDRIKTVQGALAYRNSINGRCMNYSEYDTYSTPSRDRDLVATFNNLKNLMQDIQDDGAAASVDFDLYEMMAAIFKNTNNRSHAFSQLSAKCPIKVSSYKTINLQQLYYRFDKGMISSHPNDGLDQRWGETTSNRTRCKKWY